MSDNGRQSPIVGIDLGTTNSLVAIAHGVGAAGGAGAGVEVPRVLRDDRGQAMLPSAVRFADSRRGDGTRASAGEGAGEVTVGEDARALAAAQPEWTILSIKRLMGRSRADAERSGDLKYLGYRVVDGPRGNAAVELPDGRSLLPIEISAIILKRLKAIAERSLGVAVERAVVTVPAYFDDAQRQATRDAGRLAGLEVVRIINEPTSAALAYGLGVLPSAGTQAQNIAVFDLGGGTFDVSVLRLTPAAALGADSRGADLFQVLATAGDTHLGGDDFDHALAELFMREIRAQVGEGESGEGEKGGAFQFTPSLRQELRQASERAKIALSEAERTSVRVELGTVAGASNVYQREVTRAEFEALIAPLIDRALACCARALADAERSLGGERVSSVILVGGSTRVPLVRERVRVFFGVEPYTAIDPDQAVALGAAVQAGVLWNAGQARGAAGSKEAGSGTAGSGTAGSAPAPSSLLLDVVPLSLGIETVGGAVAKLIVRNSSVPARASEMFSTSVDNQTSIKLNVLQGEREMAADCRSLGVFHVRGLPAMPAGIPQVRVEFLVDANGILSVSAVEQRSGKRAQMQVVPNHGLTREEVDRIERESVTHAREDMTRHRVADLVANARLDLKWIRRQLDRLRAELDAEYARELDGHIERLTGLADAAAADWRSVDPNAFHQAKEDLDRASMRLHEVSIARSLRDDPPQPRA